MAEIQAPNGYETNEAIDGANDIMEVFQPGSAGTRRNKKALLNVLKAFFSSLAAGAAGRIVTLTAGGAVQDSTVNISDVNDNTTHRTSDGNDHSNVVDAYKGLNRVVLTNYTGTGLPAVAANSVCEINGLLYTNPSEVAITGATSNTTWYDILLTPSGTTFTASFIARGTGVWSDSKHGLYSGNNRVVACAYRNTSSTNWINKNILIVNNRTIVIKMEIGDWNMDLNTTVDIAHGLDFTKIRGWTMVIRQNAGEFDTRYKEGYTSTGDDVLLAIYVINDTNIRCWRKVGGFFDGALFNSTSYNRGWIPITYEA